MKIESREDIRKLIIYIESNFDVNAWVIDGFHLWPLIRKNLYFHAVRKIEINNSTPKKNKKQIVKFSSFQRITNAFKTRFVAIWNYIKVWVWLNKLKKRKLQNIFASTGINWVSLDGKSFNKFADSMIHIENLEDNALVLQFGKIPNLPFSNSKNTIRIEKWSDYYTTFHKIFNKATTKNAFEGYDKFLIYLSQECNLLDFSNSFTTEYWSRFYDYFYPNVKFYKSVFEIVKPKKLHTFCYYDNEARAMIVAANQLSIETIEVQHGPMTSTHLSYHSFTVSPSEGYIDIPKTYYCWDDFTVNIFNQDSSTVPNRKVVKYGQPWLKYWESKNENVDIKYDILYALQPSPLSIRELLPEFLIEILNTSDLVICFRFHPGQTEEYKLEIAKILRERVDNTNYVLSESGNDPLPIAIMSSKIVMAHFSGVVLEARLLNKKFIVLSELGRTTFEEFILNGNGFYFDGSSGKTVDFEKLINKIFKSI